MRIDSRRGIGGWAFGALPAFGALLAFGALATHASAATLTVDRACYVLVGSPAMSFSGSGYRPHSEVVITSPDGTVDTSVRANAAGYISGSSAPPTPDFTAPGAKVVVVTAADHGITATVPVHVTVLGWEHGPVKRAPGLRAFDEKTDWSFSGFIPGRLIYGHYLYRGEPVARATFGRAAGACGVLRVRAKLFPTTAHERRYRVQYDDSRRYSTQSVPRIIGPINLSV